MSRRPSDEVVDDVTRPFSSEKKKVLQATENRRQFTPQSASLCMPVLITLLIVILLPALWMILVYNGLIAKRNMVDQALSSIDVQLKKRHDLIPNLVSTVKGFMEHERDVLEQVTELRQRAAALPPNSAERFTAENQLGAGVTRILARAEAYPDLRSGENFLQLQRALVEVEEQISASRRAYNAAVMDLNNGVQMFPGSLVAGQMKLEERPYFEADDDERGTISVEM